MILRCILSGMQTGADIAGVISAKKSGIQTTGWMPKGFKTQDGPHPEYAELYGAKEHESSAYPPRTFANVKESSGTIRIASNFDSAGERCTMKAIQQYQRPHFDVYVADVKKLSLPESMHPLAAAQWIVENKIEVLNVAGNSERTANGIQSFAERYIDAMIKYLRNIEHEKSESV